MDILIALAFALFFLGYGVNHFLGNETVGTIVAILGIVVGVYQLIQLF